jgi:hypothetical protein
MGDEVNVTEWMDCIEELIWCKGVEFFKVVEETKLHGKSVLLIRGIGIVEEDDLCLCDDMDNILLNHSSILSGFLVNTVKIFKEDTFTFNLIFKTGRSVCITKLCEYEK